MKLSGWISATFLASTVLSTETLPFSPPETPESGKGAYDILLRLLKRDGDCPAGYNACSNMDKTDICCRQGSECARDEADNIACCPTGASCTGSLTTGGGGGAGGAGASSTSFRFPRTATATQTTAPNDATITGSTLPGAYPFIYVPTSFSNAGVCSSYYSRCEDDYTQCLSELGGGYAVTVGGNGGAGVTRGDGSKPSAVSTCSSLSQEACHGLNLGYCETYHTQTDDESRANTGRTTSLQDLVFGVIIGAAGMLV